MDQPPEASPGLIFGIAILLVCGATWVYNDLDTNTNRGSLKYIYDVEEIKRNQYVSDLAKQLNRKIASTTSLNDEEMLLNRCVAKKQASEAATRDCFWDSKQQFEIEEKQREQLAASERAKKAAAQALANDAAERRSLQLQTAGIPSTVMPPAPPLLNGRPSYVDPYHKPLISVPSPKPTGPMLPGRMTNQGVWIPPRQLQN
jgi:hypothetical protein